MIDWDAPLPSGKLPNPLLESLITRFVALDESVLIGPGVGRDAAVIRVGSRALVVKTDPITFVTGDAGHYLVNVNANDIACMGATPRWLLVTSLLPERSTTPRLVEELFASVTRAAGELEISLIGGHTEITIGLDRPILVGQMLGDADPSELIDPSRCRPGDAVLLCNGIAIEGTAILATEAAGRLSSLPAGILASAARLLVEPGISVLPALRALRLSKVAIHALHDPTEGGLATALNELASASGAGISINAAAIHVLPESRAVCAALGLDPLGLIASGALLAVIPAEQVSRALGALSMNGIAAAKVGTLLDDPAGRWITRDGERAPLPTFAVDEIARFFASSID